MKKLLLPLCLLLCQVIYAQFNLQLLSNLPYNNSLANIGGYVDSLGNEYALVGWYNGLSIVNVTDPAHPVIAFQVNGPASEWREVKTYRRFAYVTTEGGASGLQVVDLSKLPGSVNSKYYSGDGAIAGQLQTIHALHIDTAKAFLYLYGSNINNGNSLFINISNPWNPVYAGQYIYPGASSSQYVHDGFVINDTLYECHIYDGFFTVVDGTNKSAPKLLAEQITPGAFTHNSWLSTDHRTVFTTDEVDNSFLTAYDISDLSNIKELSEFQTAPGSGAIVHNTHIIRKGGHDFAVTSWYTEGVVITDMTYPDNPVEVGHYDTYPQGSGGGFNGCWGVYPFLPSGNIVASDIDNGLFVLGPTYTPACFIQGVITDSMTGTPIVNATVNLLTTTVSRQSDFTGLYKAGIAAAGLYDVQVYAAGYQAKIISGVSLSTGVTTTLNVQLIPAVQFNLAGLVTDSLTNLPVANALIHFENPVYTFDTITDAQGNYSIHTFYGGAYDITCGKWGHKTQCFSQAIPFNGGPLNIVLAPGYYDDFSLDFKWTVNSSSPNVWQRGVPIGTFNGTDPSNPGYDVPTDCGNQCWVTDNGGGAAADHDVDNGFTELTSPAFDATIYLNPVINMDTWFYNADGPQGPANDTMKISLSNGTLKVAIDSIYATKGNMSQWVHRTYPIENYLSLSANMKIIINVADQVGHGNITEGGIDKFFIDGQLATGINDLLTDRNNPRPSISVYPNPFNDEINLSYYSRDVTGNSLSQVITDMIGREVFTGILASSSGTAKIGEHLKAGIYFVTILNGREKSATVKIVKTE